MGVTWSHTSTAQQLRFGPDALDVVDEVVRGLGLRRVLLVTTEGRLASAVGERVTSRLGRALAATYDGVPSHVPTSTVEEAVRLARTEGVDGVVSLGGGSCADLGKAVCYFTEQQSGTPGASYTDRPALPHVSIPTTYSGAELTGFFGMTDEAARVKTGAGGPTIAPVAVIYDPVAFIDLPVRPSAETAMNALAHGVECAYSPHRSPEAEAIALSAVRRIASALPEVVDHPEDLAGRTALLTGAVLAGRCLQNAAMGVHHGLSQLVGGRTGIPHGLANALILAHAVRFNEDAIGEMAARIGAELGDADDPAGAVDRLRDRAALPARLSDVGVTEDDVDAVVRMSQGNRSVQANVRPVTDDDARAILEAAF